MLCLRWWLCEGQWAGQRPTGRSSLGLYRIISRPGDPVNPTHSLFPSYTRVGWESVYIARLRLWRRKWRFKMPSFECTVGVDQCPFKIARSEEFQFGGSSPPQLSTSHTWMPPHVSTSHMWMPPPHVISHTCALLPGIGFACLESLAQWRPNRVLL